MSFYYCVDRLVFNVLYLLIIRYKDGKWDADAEANYNVLKKYYMDKIEKYGTEILQCKKNI